MAKDKRDTMIKEKKEWTNSDPIYYLPGEKLVTFFYNTLPKGGIGKYASSLSVEVAFDYYEGSHLEGMSWDWDYYRRVDETHFEEFLESIRKLHTGSGWLNVSVHNKDYPYNDNIAERYYCYINNRRCIISCLGYSGAPALSLSYLNNGNPAFPNMRIGTAITFIDGYDDATLCYIKSALGIAQGD